MKKLFLIVFIFLLSLFIFQHPAQGATNCCPSNTIFNRSAQQCLSWRFEENTADKLKELSEIDTNVSTFEWDRLMPPQSISCDQDLFENTCNLDEDTDEYYCILKGGATPSAPPGATCGYIGLSCCINQSSDPLICITGEKSLPFDDPEYGAKCQCVKEEDVKLPAILLMPNTCFVKGITPEYGIIPELSSQKIPLANGIETAIGCVPTKPEMFIKVFLNWAIGIAGGIAFIFMLFAAFQILASRGNPEALKAAQEQLTAAVIGLLFIIFSVFLLRIIGVPIMNIGS